MSSCVQVEEGRCVEPLGSGFGMRPNCNICQLGDHICVSYSFRMAIVSLGAVVCCLVAFIGCGASGKQKTVGNVATLRSFCGPRKAADSGSGAVRLTIDNPRFTAGSEAEVRLVNESSHGIAFNLYPTVEKNNDGHWIAIPLRPNGHPVARTYVKYVLGPRSNSKCGYVPLSAGWPAGRYRMRQSVVARLGKGHRKLLQLSAPFRIATD